MLDRRVGGGYLECMAYDEHLAVRIRELVGIEPAVTEQRMFGGLSFLINGHMAVAASGRGGLMVRVDPTRSAALLASTPAEPMVMAGRAMTGWLRLASTDVSTKRQLQKWVDTGVSYARSLPPKAPSKRRDL